MAEGETQYNIPVSSKQLIVYFVFLVIALSAAFLAGVMVGKNVDASPEPVVRDIDDRTPEEAVSSPTPDPLTYGSTLQGDKIEGLAPAPTPGAVKLPIPAGSARPTPGRPATAPSIPPRISESRPATPAPSLAAKTTPKPAAKFTTPPAKPGPKPSGSQTGPRTAKSPADSVVRLTIQVGAFKERAAAEAIVKRLKGKGYSAYLVPVSDGLFNVRVGSFTDREDAERILAKLETQEKFKPFIVKP